MMKGDFVDLDDTLKSMETDPLLDHLKTPSEKVAEAGSTGTDTVTDLKDIPPPPSPEPGKGEFVAGPGPEPTRKKVKFERMSSGLVEIIDQVQEPTFEWLYKISHFNRQERSDLRRIRRMFEINRRPKETIIGTPYENDLLDRALAWDEYCKTLALDEDDKKEWAEAWHDIIKGADVEVTPGKAFLFTTAIIFLPRLIPILKEVVPGIFEKLYAMLTGTAEEEKNHSGPERKFSYDEK